MPIIRDTIDPLNEREVPDEEALDLERMGILLTGTRAKTPEGLTAAAVRQVLRRNDEVAVDPSHVDGLTAVDDTTPVGDDVDTGDTDPSGAPDDTDDTQES